MLNGGSRPTMQVALTDPLRVLSIPPVLEILTGIAAEDWLSSRFLLIDSVHPEDRDVFRSMVAPDLSEPRGDVTMRMRHTDGTTQIVRAAFAKRRDEASGEVILEVEFEGGNRTMSPALQTIATAFDR
jgi:hypothetical protein